MPLDSPTPSLSHVRTMLSFSLEEARKNDPANEIACLQRLTELHTEAVSIYEEMGCSYRPTLYTPFKAEIKQNSADFWTDKADDYWNELRKHQVARRNRKGADHGPAAILNVGGIILHRVDSHGITRWWCHEYHQHFKSVKEFRQFLKAARTVTVW